MGNATIPRVELEKLFLILNELIHDNATISSAGETADKNIKGATHIDLLISVGGIVGTPSIQFHVDVKEEKSGQTIRTYSGTSLTSAGTDYITIDRLTLGQYIRVRWTGTLDVANYVTGVFVRLIAKR